MPGFASFFTPARAVGLAIVLLVHGAILYGLWRQRLIAAPAEISPVFVSLIAPPPPPREAPRNIELPKPAKAEIAPLPAPAMPRQLAVEMPAVAEPVAALPPPPAPKVEPPAPAIVAPPPEPPAPAKPEGPVMLGGELALACPQRTSPAYPPLSRRMGEEGKTVLRVELDEAGRIDRAVVATSSGYARLDAAALNAVKQWRCEPAKRDGQAVRALATQPFNFVLEGQ